MKITLWLALALLPTGARAASVRSLLPQEVFINKQQAKIGDMVFDVEKLTAPRGSIAAPDEGRITSRLQAGFWVYQASPWPGGKLPVAFDFWPDRNEIAAFRRACMVWANHAAVRCELKMTERAVKEGPPGAGGPGGPDRTMTSMRLPPPLPVSRDEGALRLLKADGCWSTVGRPHSGRAAMSLGSGCWGHAVILHELAHAFGAMHEHQRPDAGDYIEVDWANIDPEYHFAYLPLARTDFEAGQATDYDLESLMHYAPSAFSVGGPTFKLRPKYKEFEGRVGVANEPSKKDGEGMTRFYGPKPPPKRSDAAFVAGVAPPKALRPGETARVSATFKNTGKTTWSARTGFKLGSESPRDNHIWGGSRVGLESGERIKPGESKTFAFNITAPKKPGVYDLQVRMLQETVEWFGAFSPKVRVEVRKVESIALPVEDRPFIDKKPLMLGSAARP